jgi:hypothetical protein
MLPADLSRRKKKLKEIKMRVEKYAVMLNEGSLHL